MMSWDYLLGLTTEFTECSEAEKRGKKRKLMFLDDRECARFHLSPLCSLCPRWLNFLVGWGFVFEEAFLTE